MYFKNVRIVGADSFAEALMHLCQLMARCGHRALETSQFLLNLLLLKCPLGHMDVARAQDMNLSMAYSAGCRNA